MTSPLLLHNMLNIAQRARFTKKCYPIKMASLIEENGYDEKKMARDEKSKKMRRKVVGPAVIVKTARGGRTQDADPFNLDWDVEYSLNKNNRWELKDTIAGQLPNQENATLASVKIGLRSKELEKLDKSQYANRYNLRDVTAQEFYEAEDGALVHKTSKKGRTQLRTWTEPLKHSRPAHYQEEEREICICGKCKPRKERITDYTIITYTSTCKDGDRNKWRCKEVPEEDPDLWTSNDEPTSHFVKYIPKQKKNEMRRQKHSKHLCDW